MHGSRSASEGISRRSASDVEDEVTEVSPSPENNGIYYLLLRAEIRAHTGLVNRAVQSGHLCLLHRPLLL